jgi:hypothetical protein
MSGRFIFKNNPPKADEDIGCALAVSREGLAREDENHSF